MRQYVDAKKEAPEDAILLFRMGDFYEVFFEDAQRAAPLMDVVLTKRGGVPMCGVPYHALQSYVGRLLDGGVKVAIAEQLEDPKQAKGIVKRGITRVITPGTVVDDQVLSAGRSNFLACLCPGRSGRFGFAVLDISTGDFRATELADRAALETELHRIHPAECLVPQDTAKRWESEGVPDAPERVVWTGVEDWRFDLELGMDELLRHFRVSSLDGFGFRGHETAVCAAAAVIQYARNNLRRDASHVTSIRYYHSHEYMVLDRISQRNLELVDPVFADTRNATLVSVLDSTVTPMGARLLREWILRPLRLRAPIEERLDAVALLVRDPLLLGELREALGSVRDLERTIVRLGIGSANARDLQVLQHGLEAVPGLRAILEHADAALIRSTCERLTPMPELVEHVARAIVDEPPTTTKDGGMIRNGYHDDLDMLRDAAVQGKGWIAALQAQEQKRTGINSLKVRYNRVFGYYIEITKANLDLVPDDYLRKQTLTNAERFITPELKEIEDKILGAEEKSKALEYELFQNLRDEAVAATAEIQAIARAVAVLDVLASLADAAVRNDYARPEIREDTHLSIEDGRHPVLDRLLTDERFVPNDTLLDTDRNQIAVITGPNMAGKSTYIRQVALITVLAQMGSFVPARAAQIGLVDRVFTRVGAADDLSRGQSTFMVEMVETANILNNATPRSLIILDEVGRGTSTFDGLSLAWAVTEYLHNNPEVKARTLFATHYHELTELELTLSGVKNYNVAVREWGEEIIFLRKILRGGADKSYGIHVARLAGLPVDVVDRAREVLSNLEGNAFSETGQPKIARTRRRRPRETDPTQQPTLFDLP
jgi:DNA mismatch repair protein MutS